MRLLFFSLFKRVELAHPRVQILSEFSSTQDICIDNFFFLFFLWNNTLEKFTIESAQGIFKIWNLENLEVYVSQKNSVNQKNPICRSLIYWYSKLKILNAWWTAAGMWLEIPSSQQPAAKITPQKSFQTNRLLITSRAEFSTQQRVKGAHGDRCGGNWEGLWEINSHSVLFQVPSQNHHTR